MIPLSALISQLKVLIRLETAKIVLDLLIVVDHHWLNKIPNQLSNKVELSLHKGKVNLYQQNRTIQTLMTTRLLKINRLRHKVQVLRTRLAWPFQEFFKIQVLRECLKRMKKWQI